jgi:hypothetical protein
MSFLDVYGRTHELDAKSVDTIATRLEARRGSTKYMGMLQEYLEAIDLAAGHESGHCSTPLACPLSADIVAKVAAEKL